MDRGWIKLYRKFTEWEWYDNSDMLKLYLTLISMANYEDKKWEGIVIKRGQLVTSRDKLSKITGISEQSIRTYIKRLISTNEITSVSTNKYTIITICNYEDYQQTENQSNQQTNQQTNQQLTSNQPTTNQQLTTTKEYKEYKEYKEEREEEEKKYNPPPRNSFENENLDNSKNQNQTLSKEEKEKRKKVAQKKEKESATVDVSKYLDIPILECKKLFLSDEAHMETLMRTLKLTPTKIQTEVEIYFKEQEAKGVQKKSLSDAKMHFVNWYNYHKPKEQAKKNAHNTLHNVATNHDDHF